MRVAVVGHVEWIQFARVEHVPAPGEIVHASESWQLPAGGGAVAAVQLARLAGECLFLTALGDDEFGHRAVRELEAKGVRVVPAWRDEPTRQGFVHLDARGERAITVLGDRLAPHRDGSPRWDELKFMDAIYLTAGNADAIRAARDAHKLVATPRTMETLREAGVQLDALVLSAKDPGERYEPGDLEPPPHLILRTEGGAGGAIVQADGSTSRWTAAPVEGRGDSYGAGDCFAAGFTFGLGEGLSPDDAAALGARAGAACMSGRGPYEGQIDHHHISSG